MKKCSFVEVGPRDGLQNHSRVLTLAERESFVRRLVADGVLEVEVGSFVRDDRIPQLAQTAKLVSKLQKFKTSKGRQPLFWAFVPNVRGMELALETAIDGVGLFVAASETFCNKNVNRTQAELLLEIKNILPMAKAAKRKVRVYLSTITFCPYEGAVRPAKVKKLVRNLIDMGVDEVSLGDTTGHATPLDISKLLAEVLKVAPAGKITMHLHDTRGLAMANVWESMRHGLNRFDSSLGGLGGCPYAPGAAGNLATEDLLFALNSMGAMKSTVDLNKLTKTSLWLEKQIGAKLPSKVLATFRKQS